MTSDLRWARSATRFLLFTGKGGVGKSTLAAATAVTLADDGRRVLLVSTDPASNFNDILGTTIEGDPVPVAGVAGLDALNIDPEAAADDYRRNVLDPLRGTVPDDELRSIEEQLAGQCTVEVAAFDEFSSLLADPIAVSSYDHIVFDTAPTGHTLRLLALPAAWSNYIEESPEGASCLGPLASLESKRALYEATVDALGDPERTTILLVSRPEASALIEADRAGLELASLGISHQRLLINGLLEKPRSGDRIAQEMADRQRAALDDLPSGLSQLPTHTIPLLPGEMIGIAALRDLRSGMSEAIPESDAEEIDVLDTPDLEDLVAELADAGPGLVMFMGKGGVGKTSIAIAVAKALSTRGLPTHLSTTDPAGDLPGLVGGAHPDSLSVSRIDPADEVRRYVEHKLASARDLEPEQLALLEEDLRSPCTEEIAVFAAFSSLLRRGRSEYVVIDTAPSGHTLLLLDRTGAYHREVTRTTRGLRVRTPLMRLRDPDYTRVVLVTLAETTPVHEASQLQEDLERAGVVPFGWVVNASLAASGTTDPVLRSRARAELPLLETVRTELAQRVWLVPWGEQQLAAVAVV